MKILSYLRVSTESQTVEPQRIEIASYVARQNWTIVKEYSDVISGSKASRVGLDALVAHCESGGVEAVVVVKLDRLGRSVMNVVSLVQRLSAMGVAVICTSQGIDTRDSNPCGKMILSIMAAFAEFERDIIRERTRSGLVAARAAGKQLGRISKLMPGKPERAAIVARWRDESEGVSYIELGRMLGGVSASTAWRVARDHPAVVIAAPDAKVAVNIAPEVVEEY